MKESGFSVQHPKKALKIQGGRLWQMADRSKTHSALVLEGDTLSIYLEPHEDLNNFLTDLYKIMRRESPYLYYTFILYRQLPSLVRFIPVSLTIWGIAFISIYSQFIIDWLIEGKGDENNYIGLTRKEAFFLCGAIATALLYFFPVIITGDQESVVEKLNRYFSANQIIGRKFKLIASFLYRRTEIKRVEIWNPNFEEGEQDWVKHALIPALLDSPLALSLEVKIDERGLVENYLAKLLNEETEEIAWKTLPYPESFDHADRSLPYLYLEPWERRLLGVYVFASTATLPKTWLGLQGNWRDGVLRNAVSLRLVELLVEQFKERLFDEEERGQLISMDGFAARCLNDFGILLPCLEDNNDVWEIHPDIVKLELDFAQNQLAYLSAYLQINIEYLSSKLQDPAAALVLNGVHLQRQVDIYNPDRLEAIRFFVRSIQFSEQYNVLKQYWSLVSASTQDHSTAAKQEIFRILGRELLIDLALLFEKAAQYEWAHQAWTYVQHIQPFAAQLGFARIHEKRGDFSASEQVLAQLLEAERQGQTPLQNSSAIDLRLNYAWTIVSGRLDKRQAGRLALEEVEALLFGRYDQLRNSDQMIRLYNIKANYEEWEGRPEQALLNYDQALEIPGVAQWNLSNLLVNKGIALRQRGRHEAGIIFGEKGVQVKTAIGDYDQLPIAQHNLAQTCLEWAFGQLKAEAREPFLRKALSHAQNGLAIQARTGSVKKRGQLLAEHFLSAYGLGLEPQILQTTWNALGLWLQDEAQAGRQTSYDFKVVITELLGLIPNLKGLSWEEQIQWKPV